MDSLSQIADKLSCTLEEYSIVGITDPAGRIVYANDNFCKISKYSRRELLGQNHRIINSGHHPDEFFKEMWNTISKGQVWHGEIKNRAKDGTFYWVDTHIVPYFDHSGKITEYVAVRVDITDRKLAAEKEKVHHEQLQQADKLASIGTLTTGVAHEINNPNQLILSNSDTLLEIFQEILGTLEDHVDSVDELKISGLSYSEIKEIVPQALTRVKEGSVRIKKIVESLKHYARKEDSSDRSSVHINVVVKSTLVLVESLIKKSTNHFHLDLDNDIPSFHGNFQQIEQVLVNLVTNSCQALENKEQEIRIRTYYDDHEKNIILEVIDTGAGIKPENLNKVSDPFYTTKLDSGGTGLGLYVCYSIINQHKGRLEFKSSLGEETRAKVILPAIAEVKKGESNE